MNEYTIDLFDYKPPDPQNALHSTLFSINVQYGRGDMNGVYQDGDEGVVRSKKTFGTEYPKFFIKDGKVKFRGRTWVIKIR